MQGERDPLPYNLPSTSEREDSRADPDCSDGIVDEELGYDLELMDICNEGEQSENDVDFDSFTDSSDLDEMEKEYEMRRMNALTVSISDVSDLSEWVKTQQLDWSQLVQQYLKSSGEQDSQRMQKRLEDGQPGRVN